MITKIVEVRTYVEVTVDETKFTEKFMEDFRSYMMPYETLDDHIEHLGYMEVIGGFTNFDRFLEGYGDIDEMGIKTKVVDTEIQIVDEY